MKFMDNWLNLYHLDPQEAHPVDWEMSNWYVSTHPDSMFAKSIIVSIFKGNQRFVLVNRDLTVRNATTGAADKKEIASATEFFDALRENFDIQLQEGTSIKIPTTDLTFVL